MLLLCFLGAEQLSETNTQHHWLSQAYRAITLVGNAKEVSI